MKESNILIADFMEFQKTFVRNYKGVKYDYDIPNGFELIKETETTIESQWCEILMEQDCCIAEDLKFHSSWDWLMPVIEKILNRNVTPVKCKDINEHLKQPEFLERKVYQRVVNTLVTCDINTIYEAVIAFITWYNEHKLNEND